MLPPRISNFLKKTEAKDKFIHQVALDKFDHSNKLGTLRPEVKDYRCNAIITADESNTPIIEIIKLGKSWVDEYSGYTLGSETDIINSFEKSVLPTLIERISCILCGGGCFDEYSVTFDGAPSVAEA